MDFLDGPLPDMLAKTIDIIARNVNRLVAKDRELAQQVLRAMGRG